MYILCCMLAWISGVTSVSAQINESVYLYRSYNQINDVAVDYPYAWCATRDGVVCWDVEEGTYAIFDESYGLPYGAAMEIVISSEGTVMAALSGSLFYEFVENEWRESPLTNMTELQSVQGLEYDSDEVLYIQVSRDIYRYDGSNVEKLDTGRGIYTIGSDHGVIMVAVRSGCDCSSLPPDFIIVNPETTSFDSSVFDMARDENEDIWLATKVGLVHIDRTTATVYTAEDGFPCEDTNDVYNVAVDDSDSVWLSQPSSGIIRFDGRDFTTYTMAENQQPLAVTCIETYEDMVFAGTTYGLAVYRDGAWTEYRRDDTPILTCTVEIAVDAGGVLWFLGEKNGVKSFDGSSWEWHYLDGYQKDKAVFRTAVSPDGFLLMNMGDILKYNGDTWVEYDFEDADELASFAPFAMDENGFIWTEGVEDGMRCFNGESWVTYDREIPFFSGDVNAILPQAGNILWVATDNGLSRFDGYDWITFTTDYGLSSNNVKDLALDSRGRLWIAMGDDRNGHSGCVAVLDVLDFTVYTKADGLCPGDVEVIHVDAGDTVWAGSSVQVDIGVYDSGISRFDGAAWKTFRSTDGFPSGEILDIEETGSDDLWIATSYGVVRLDKAVFDGSTAVDETETIPSALSIEGSYPNPFNPETTIAFFLPETGHVTFDVYNIAGQKVRTLESGTMSAGHHETVWNGRDDTGTTLASGVYFGVLRQGEIVTSHRMLLMK